MSWRRRRSATRAGLVPDRSSVPANTNTLTPDLLRRRAACWRAASRQIYRRDNRLLKRPLACCGGVPVLETLAAVSIMRVRLPELRIRVVNVVDLMRLQPRSERPRGLSDVEFDALFTTDRRVIFAFHVYPWPIHRLTNRRTNHSSFHVRGHEEEGTITTPFDVTVLNDMDRFQLVMDTIDRLRQTGEKGLRLKWKLEEQRAGHRRHFDEFGEDLPEIRNGSWDASRRSHSGASHGR